jgi:hypothetical protein
LLPGSYAVSIDDAQLARLDPAATSQRMVIRSSEEGDSVDVDPLTLLARPAILPR